MDSSEERIGSVDCRVGGLEENCSVGGIVCSEDCKIVGSEDLGLQV